MSINYIINRRKMEIMWMRNIKDCRGFSCIFDRIMDRLHGFWSSLSAGWGHSGLYSIF